MTDPFAATLPAIRAAFGEAIVYAGAGLAEPTDLPVIWSDVAGGPFQGPGNTTRTVSCEIEKLLLPNKPAKSDRIVRGSVTWQPQQVLDRDDVGAWVITLEQV